ncbi:hypothetical protein [Aliikangiella coralliicola]|uniref:Uncharacterized protein n=1 Tax=Aliikangiella coralliicola TaxID=2592383 RepID=A0A545UER8_9GAMM|nr:hypothetical protein [Aliikangiella coralliicola]TQV87935.1 hypothetical protein FLL46_11190 [Aliikangiella coralliicola]
MKHKEINFKRPSLEQIDAYENPNVISRFVDIFGVTSEEAIDIFTHTKKWLWLAHEQRLDQTYTNKMEIDEPLLVIDEMWHNFVLFTKDYTNFCFHYFGYYLHHQPTTDAEKIKFQKEIQSVPLEQKDEVLKDKRRPQYECTYDKLGRKAFEKLYFEYPKKYSKKQLAELCYQQVTKPETTQLIGQH